MHVVWPQRERLVNLKIFPYVASKIWVAVILALYQAVMEKDIEDLEDGLETMVGPKGVKLSGGQIQRVSVARALIPNPRVILADEPVSMVDASLRMEIVNLFGKLRDEERVSVIFITHDRRFLRSLATRIVELDRGKATDWPGDYDNYLRRREERDNAEALENARFDKRLAQEEAWIRQGIKARRTRNEGRVRRLEAMRREYGERRNRQGTARLAMNSSISQ